MDYNIIILNEAQKEFEEAAILYEEQKAGLGKLFIDSVENRLGFIVNNPEKYAKRKANFREAPLKIYPYNIVYIYYKRKKQIVVVAIFHTSRKPQKKYR